jgi:hypothetical protein
MASDLERVARNLRLTLALHDEGVRLMRQNLRCRHPDLTDSEIDQRLRAWLSERPGAEHGDGVGRPGRWPRR